MIVRSFLSRYNSRLSVKNPNLMLCNRILASSRQKLASPFPKFSVNTVALVAFGCVAATALQSCNNLYSEDKKSMLSTPPAQAIKKDSGTVEVRAPLDTALYNRNIVKITNGDSSGRWPAKAAIPNAGAILPFKRIVAYYGNFYSKKMGV